MNVKILFSDKLHFHKRNFRSLLDLINRQGYLTEYNLENEDIIAKYGDYDVNDSRIIEGYKYLEKLSKCDLFEDLSEQEKLELEIQNSYEMPQVNAVNLGNLLVNYRKKFKTTQQELARRTGITAGTGTLFGKTGRVSRVWNRKCHKRMATT